MILMPRIICEISPVLCRMHRGATVKLVESSASKPAMHVSSAQRRQCHSRSPKKGYEKAWHCPLILHMANTFLETRFICMFHIVDAFVMFLHTPCFNTISMISTTTVNRQGFDNGLSRTCRAQHQGTPPSQSDLGAQRAILHNSTTWI